MQSVLNGAITYLGTGAGYNWAGNAGITLAGNVSGIGTVQISDAQWGAALYLNGNNTCTGRYTGSAVILGSANAANTAYVSTNSILLNATTAGVKIGLTSFSAGSNISAGRATEGTNVAQTLQLNDTADKTVTGTWGGTGTKGNFGVEKNGAGALTLGTASTYTGATVINAGKMYINAASASVTAKNGATLGGTGTLQAIAIETGSFLSAGATGRGAAGTLTGTSLLWNGGATMLVDLNSSATYDKIVLTGALTKGTGTGFVFDLGNTTNAFGQYTLITAASITGFTLADFSVINAPTVAGYTGALSMNSTGVYYTIPEPSTYGLIGAGALGAASFIRRRRAKAGVSR